MSHPVSFDIINGKPCILSTYYIVYMDNIAQIVNAEKIFLKGVYMESMQ